jgi:hypothetical protein
VFPYGVSEADANVSVVVSTLDEADLVPINSFGLAQAQFSLGVGTNNASSMSLFSFLFPDVYLIYLMKF